jgi:hypothetical protein
MRLVDQIDRVRVALDLFPRCLKCNQDLRGERLSNLVEVVGRENRFMHGCCPRGEAAEDAA